jgi:hypothetical protein
LGHYHRALSEEAEKSFEELIERLVDKFCASQELFDKFITVERFKTGFGQIRQPLTMDGRCSAVVVCASVVGSRCVWTHCVHL